MEIILKGINIISHIDTYIFEIVNNLGFLSYIIFGAMIFIETGFVIIPFLPGDSILFVIGLLSAKGLINLWVVILILAFSAILGDTCNYTIGHFLGGKLLKKEKIQRLIGKQVNKTKDFFNKYGGVTIIYARFIPGIRVVAPFLAGITNMKYKKFISYNIIGGILWIVTITMLGYFLGNISFIKEHLTLILLSIVFISLLPPLYSYVKLKKKQVKSNG